MKRALYLDGGQPPPQVSVDGPALRICREGRADAKAPLRLLSRIIVHGTVAWQTAALISCMDAGVPVTFVTGDGTARGWCVGTHGENDDINELLEECALGRDWPGRHEDWLRAMERRAMLALLPRSNAPPANMRPADLYQERTASIDRWQAPVETRFITDTLTGALEAHLVDLFRRFGVAARFVCGHGSPVHLLSDFRRLLRWDLWPVAERSALYFCRHGVRRAHAREARRRLLRQYEASGAHIEKRFGDLFWRLRAHLQGMLP